jgi:putative ABC transport system permease protein
MAVVVGVAADVRQQHLASASNLDVYRPYRQFWAGGSWFVVRTQGVHPSSLARVAPAIVPEIDPNQSYFDVQVMSDRIAAGIWQARASGSLFGVFAALAAVLAAIGLYGVLSYQVTQQHREIGVRLALGAEPRAVVKMIIGRGFVLAGIGVAAGLVVASMASRALSTVLYEVNATDPWTFAGIATFLGSIALLASAVPAMHATRIDPIVALRAE